MLGFRNAEVCNPGVPVFFEDNILRLQVLVDDMVGVDVLEAN